jgi:glycyl-tRNA synthetase beta subunit
MCVGLQQDFELIDTQKTDHALEKYTGKVVRKAFNRLVASKTDLSVQANRDNLLNEITEKMEELPRGSIIEGQSNWSVVFYRRDKASASICCKGPCMVF